MRKPDRVYLLDELRGLAVLLMIFYHGAYDAVYLFRFTGTAWFTSAPMAFLQRYIAGIQAATSAGAQKPSSAACWSLR